MKLKDWLKIALPTPRIPQKRYLILLGLILYWLSKAYVTYTPTPNDDHIPDMIKDAIKDSIVVVFANRADADPIIDALDEDIQYGEQS